MKKMKKILGLGRKRKEQQTQSRSRVVASASAPVASILGCGGDGGGGGSYRVRSKDLGKLHRAAAEGDLGELRHLLQKHDLNEPDKADRTPLHFACANGYMDIVTFLVDNRCQLNICDNDKRSPLMKAVQCQQEFCVVYLLEHGADPNLKDLHNNTALHFSAFNSSITVAKYLLEHKAHIEAQNEDGSTPLMVAVAENNREMVEFLLKKGASVHATDKLGRTPLLISASNKKRDLTNILLLHGSDVSHRDESGWSAEDYAMISDDPILTQYIAEYSSGKKREEASVNSQKVLSVLSNPEKLGDAGITLGAPATNKEVIDDHSSGESIRNSEKIDDDSWLSSEEEELDLSPKKTEKPSLAQLKNITQQFKKKLDEKNSTSLKQNKSECEVEDFSKSTPKSLFQVKTIPHAVHSSPGSFSKCSQMPSHFKQVESSEEGGRGGVQKDQNISDVMDKTLIYKRQSWDLSPKAKSALRTDKEEEKDAESPWDSECTSESPRKPTIGSLPTSPAKTKTRMHSIAEESCDEKPSMQPKITKENLEHQPPTPVLKKTDLMEELGLDYADDMEDESDWDSTSVSLKASPHAKPANILMLEDYAFPKENLEHQPPTPVLKKTDLMEELGLDYADDMEDESDWDSTSVSLKASPHAKPANILMLEDYAFPKEKPNFISETAIPMKEESDTLKIISLKDQHYNEHKDIKEFESNSKKWN